MKYRCIVADPPWPQKLVGKFKRHSGPDKLPYSVMTISEIASMTVSDLAEEAAHLWLWTTNSHLRDAFAVMEAWGFRYLNTVTWVKPSGLGAWFANTTQHVLFGYMERCEFPLARWRPTHFNATPLKHSQKPEEFYNLARSISPGPRLDLFNRRVIEGFDGWGDQSPNSTQLDPDPRLLGKFEVNTETQQADATGVK